MAAGYDPTKKSALLWEGVTLYLSETGVQTGEGLDFGFSFAKEHAGELRRFVESEGLEVVETHFLGAEDEKGPFSVVASLRV